MTHQALQHDLTGQVLLPDDEGYADSASALFGTGEPAVVVRPRDVAGVAAAITYAQQHGLVLSVRSGGHGALGSATNEGGMVLDLAHLDSVEIGDAEWPVVRIGGGATWGKVASTLAPYGLGLTAGDTAGVGVGGLTLGGGVGWMVRKHGLAIDNLVAARVVTADGQVVDVSDKRHSDLFWAIRGGGGNYGVVVSFDFVAESVGDVHFGTIAYEPTDARQVVEGWRDHLRTATEDLTSTVSLVPSMFGMPESVMVSVCYAGDDSGVAGALDPLRELGTVVSDDVRVMPYAEILDEAHDMPPGIRVIARNTLLPMVDDGVIEAVVAAWRGGIPTTLRSLGGAFGRVPADATPFAHRDAETLARLTAIKRELDPGNVFHRTHNIPPSGGPTEGTAA